jgi:RNase H-like domain found in reverse transcriptase
MVAYSNGWKRHLQHLANYLSVIKNSGMKLKLKKCQLAQYEVKLFGHIVGFGTKRADHDKVAAFHDLKIQETKRQVRQVIRLLSHYRAYIPNFAEIAKPLTDLTAKQVPDHIVWAGLHQQAFDRLKQLLCEAANVPLDVTDISKPFSVAVDTSEYEVGAVLSQPSEGGTDQPVAFESFKLTPTQGISLS